MYAVKTGSVEDADGSSVTYTTVDITAPSAADGAPMKERPHKMK